MRRNTSLPRPLNRQRTAQRVFKAAIVTTAILSGPIYAQNINWNAGAGDSLWTSANNWAGNVLPGVNNTPVFNVNAATTISLNGTTQTVAGLSFNQASVYTLTNGSLVLNSLAQTVNVNNLIQVPITTKNTGADVLTANVTTNTLSLQRAVTSGGITKTGNGTLRLGTNTTDFNGAINGNIVVNGGTVAAFAAGTAGSNNPLAGSTGNITIGAANVTVSLQHDMAANNDDNLDTYDFGRDIVANNNNFTLNVDRSGASTSGGVSQAGVLTIGNATMTVTGSNGFKARLDGVNVLSGSTAILNVNNNGGNAGANNLTVDTLSGDLTTVIRKNGGQTLNIGEPSLTAPSNFFGRLELNGGTTTIRASATNNPTLNSAGITFLTNSTLNLRANVSTDFGAPISFGPGVLAQSISLDRNSGSITNQVFTVGTIDLSDGRTFTVNGSNGFTMATDGVIVSSGNGTLTTNVNVTAGTLNTAAGTTFTKLGGGTLTINQNNSATSAGAINHKVGTITATVAGALGTGLVTVGNSPNTAGFIADLPRLNWNVAGASANGTGVDAIAKAGGMIDLNATPAATDVFEIEADGRIQGNTTQLQNLTVGTNVTLAPNAIISHENPSATNATIQGLSNNADLYYGIANTANTVRTIGVGTPWKGISNADDTTDRTIQGANAATPAIISINGGDNDATTIEATFQSIGIRALNFGTTTAADGGYTWSSTAPGQKVTVAIRGALGTSNLGFVPGGRVSFNENATDTQLATAVDKIVVQGGTLGLYANQALGGVPVEVQSGGALSVGLNAGAAIDGSVTINSGGVLNLSEGPLLTGTGGAITIQGGGKLDISGAAPANILTGSSQQITFNGNGHTVRIGANNTEQLDERVPDANVTYVVASGVSQTTAYTDTNIGSSSAPISVNTQTAGITLTNGVLTNGASNAAYVGALNLNDSNLTIAATRNTSLVVQSNISTAGDIQIGSLTPIDGRDKSSNSAATNWAGVSDPYNSPAQVVLLGEFSANNVTANNSHLAFGNANTTINGDLTVNGGILYLDGGGPIVAGANSGQLTSKLVAGTLADRIILGPNTRSEMKLDLGSDSNATTLVINQPFVIDGDINPQDNRRMWISRNSGTNTRVDLADVTLREGSVFGVQMDSTSVRASLKLAGNATVSTSNSNNNLDYNSVMRDPSLPEFDGSNPVVLTQGRLNIPGWQTSNTTTSNIWGTIGAGVEINNVRGQIIFVPGSALNGVVRTQTAPVGGDSFVVSTSNSSNNLSTTPTSIGGTGRIELGRSAAANGPEDFEIRGTETTTGGTTEAPLHTHTGEIRIVNDGDSASIDGIVRSSRVNDSDRTARVQVDKIVIENGATVQLANANAIPLTVSAINLQGNGTINTAATGMTINAVNAGTGNVTFTGTQSPIINGPITAGQVTVASTTLNFPATLNSKLNVGGNNAAATVNGNVTGGLDVSGGNSTATVKGDVTGGLNVTTGTAAFDVTGAPAGTRTVTGPVTLDAGAIAVTNGTLDLGSTVITSTPTQTLAGLREMKVTGAFNLTSANTSNDVKLGPVQAQLTTGWGTNETYIYSGQFFVPDNNGNGTGTFAFAENFDDSVRVMIDGTQRLNNATFNDATGTGALTLPTGWHDVEFRFGQGTGGAGPNANDGWDTTLAFGLDVDQSAPGIDNSLTSPVRAQYTAPLDNGSMNLFRTTVSSSLTVGAGSTLKAGGLTNVGKISLTGANAKVTLNPAAGPAVQSSADSVEVSAGASGNIEIVRAGDKLTVGGMRAQGNLTIAGQGDVTVNGNVTGTAAFVHAGTGILTVNGQVDAPTTVSSGGTVGGNATFNGGLTVSNGTLTPGLSPGLMTASTLTTGINATLQLEIGGNQPGVTFDQIVITGNTVDISGSALSLTVTGTLQQNDVLTLILNNGSDANVGAFAGIANGLIITLPGGQNVQISYFDDASIPGLQLAGGNDVSVMVTVPEPSAAVALLGGIATLISLSRFRRRNS